MSSAKEESRHQIPEAAASISASTSTSIVVMMEKKSDKESDKPKISSADMTRRMVCGGLAGMIAKTATNPLERIKMLSQTGEHGLKGKDTSILGMYRNIIKNEGIIGLWAGNGANLLRVFPAKATVFSTNDFYKSILCRLTGCERATGPVTFFAGGLAGVSATALTYPLDLYVFCSNAICIA